MSCGVAGQLGELPRVQGRADGLAGGGQLRRGHLGGLQGLSHGGQRGLADQRCAVGCGVARQLCGQCVEVDVSG